MSKLLCLYGIRNTGFYVPGGIGNKYIKEKVSNSKTVYRIASTLEELVPSRNSY